MAPESEVVTIVSQDSSYKLTFDVKQSNGYNPKYDIVTDMKGGTVKPINADGRGTNDSWCITRQGAKTFDMELKGAWTDESEVSTDGKTMTLHHIRTRTPWWSAATLRRTGLYDASLNTSWCLTVWSSGWRNIAISLIGGLSV